MDWNNDLAVLGKLVLAIILGGLIGFERELAQKPAGLRTHMLVAGAAMLLVAWGNIMVAEFKLRENLNTDPIRIIEAIIVGISFLGAGTIVKGRGEEPVQGLTTAASILFTAVIGIGVALGQFVITLGATALILFINRGLGYLEQRLQTKA
jgi:putative Mg2+ transporter-C (MgtC) family protein